MLKTMKNQMLPERGEGCRCKGKTPKTLCVCVCMASSSADAYRIAREEYEQGYC